MNFYVPSVFFCPNPKARGYKSTQRVHKKPDTPRGRKEENVLFNDALNTFYLWLYGVGHMVNNHSYRERRNLLPPHGLLLPFSSKGSFVCTSHRKDSTYHSLCSSQYSTTGVTKAMVCVILAVG